VLQNANKNNVMTDKTIKDLDKKACVDLLRKNYIGRLAYIIGESPYVVPITYYYYDQNGNSIISYSLEGLKIDAMRKNQYVALEVDEIESVNHWKSVLVHGVFEELERIDAKKMLHEFSEGVKKIINTSNAKDVNFIHEFSRKLSTEAKNSPIVYRINIDEITGKFREG
jgi:nitroimidazol reductase NimA-like FMN-containing flavoprotein (pyridoxamine 5'-phosphate oxidase superfamily)